MVSHKTLNLLTKLKKVCKVYFGEVFTRPVLNLDIIMATLKRPKQNKWFLPLVYAGTTEVQMQRCIKGVNVPEQTSHKDDCMLKMFSLAVA